MKTEFVLAGTRFSVARRSRRRGLVVLIYLGFALAVLSWFFANQRFGATACLLGLASLLVLTTFAGGPDDASDERELHRRDHAYYVAHRPLAWVLIIALFAAGFRTILPALVPAGPALQSFLGQLPYAVLTAGGILFVTLPQAIVLWTERDMEPPQ